MTTVLLSGMTLMASHVLWGWGYPIILLGLMGLTIVQRRGTRS